MKTTRRRLAWLIAGVALGSCGGGSAKPSGTGGSIGGLGGHPSGSGGVAVGSGGVVGSGGKGGAIGGGGTSDAGNGGSSTNDGGLDTSTADAEPDGPSDASPDLGNAGPYDPLDMNDVTILAPLPKAGGPAVLLRGIDLADDGTSMVSRGLFDRVLQEKEDGQTVVAPETLDRLHLVAVRFDLCDRPLPGECPLADDARMRLVFQPMFESGGAEDAGFHAFYAIRNDEIAGAVAALRELARSVPAQTGALRVSPALSAASSDAYATKLRAFVKRYGGQSRLVRLTVNAQPQLFAQLRWALRGVEKKGDAFVDVAIVGATATSESVLREGLLGYQVRPAIDRPPGLLEAITETTFAAAEPAKKREYLAALAAADNPLTHTAETVACVACHVSTAVMAGRAMSASIDPLSIAGRYTSKYDLSVAGGKLAETRVTRALGYFGWQPLISQRVANETAQLLTELEKRYPAP